MAKYRTNVILNSILLMGRCLVHHTGTRQNVLVSDQKVLLCWKKKRNKLPKKKKIVDVPYVMQILKYGSPHGIGQTFLSKSLCDVAQVRLSKENAGLDYSI